MSRKTYQYHVVPAPDGGWNVRKRGALRASKHFETKADAISWGREISKNQRSEFVIHKVDGTIEKKDSYVNDPLPPKDQK
jgi:hypothetical protein